MSLKWVFWGVGAVAIVATSGLAVGAAQYKPVAYPVPLIDGKAYTGTREQIQKALASGLQARLDAERTFHSDELAGEPYKSTITDLGFGIDVEAMMAKVQFTNFVGSLTGQYKDPAPTKPVELIYFDLAERYSKDSKEFSETTDKAIADKRKELATYVLENRHPIGPAKAVWTGSGIDTTPEATGVELEESGLLAALAETQEVTDTIELPLKEGKKRVSDEALGQITTVVSSFSTRFNSGVVSRSSNIKRAAELINGTVLLPGDSFSFNGHLGRRTIENGFKVAGVYVSGRHDVDVGGGICQVSTTLYNALLMGEIEVKKRNPHSLPVPYVPLGRDAAVSFPNPDLEFVNNLDTPIALAAIYAPGKLEFKVLGSAENEKEIKFESRLISTWSRGEKVVDDPSLAPGSSKVVDRGGSGRKVQTWKIVYENGQEVKRIDLGYSVYSGGPRIIARNNRAPKPVKPATAPPAATTVPAATTPPVPPAGG